MTASAASAGAEHVRLAADEDAIEACFRRGWSDGLPVVPPTVERVDAMLDGRDPRVVLGVIPPRGGIATREKTAACAVMAGCLPEYLPVLEAITRAACDPLFNLAGIQPTTHVAAPIAIVSGPVVERIGLNARAGVFGPGSRANATLGRAFALLLWNLGGARPGVSDMSQFGNPARYGCVIAERRDVSSWAPLQVSQKVDASASAVTLFAGEAPKSVVASRRAEGILGTLADCMRTLAAANMHLQGQMLAILGPEHARALDAAGWTREAVQQRLFELARRSVGEFRALGTYGDEVWRRFWPASVDLADDLADVPVASRPQDILLTVAGGDVGRFSVCCPGWGSGSRAVTVEIAEEAMSVSVVTASRGLELVSPAIDVETAVPVRLAPGLEDLAGRAIGMVDNGKWNAAALLEAVRDRLVERFGMSGGPMRGKQHYNRDLNAEERAALSGGAQAAIAAIGDCGSCTSYTVRDALVLEELGVPTVALVTEPFVPLAESFAAAIGLQDLRLAAVAHPLYGIDPHELAERADGVVDAVVAALVEQRG